MAKILIIYGTTQGQTRKIALYIAEKLSAKGHSVGVFDSEDSHSSVHPKNYDAIIVGASVHVGSYQRRLRKWVQVHSQDLNSVPSAFFSPFAWAFFKRTGS